MADLTVFSSCWDGLASFKYCLAAGVACIYWQYFCAFFCTQNDLTMSCAGTDSRHLKPGWPVPCATCNTSVLLQACRMDSQGILSLLQVFTAGKAGSIWLHAKPCTFAWSLVGVQPILQRSPALLACNQSRAIPATTVTFALLERA
eukprot:6202002-Pleurochrysis_carterae.AAC.1